MLERVLRREGDRARAGAGVDTALAHYASAGLGPRDVGDSLGA